MPGCPKQGRRLFAPSTTTWHIAVVVSIDLLPLYNTVLHSQGMVNISGVFMHSSDLVGKTVVDMVATSVKFH